MKEIENVDNRCLDKDCALRLVDFINLSPSMYNAIDNLIDFLREYGYKEIDLKNKISMQVGGNYYISLGSSGLIAFSIKCDEIETKGLKIIGSHSDSPCFRIKPNPEVKVGDYIKLNVEPYGGMIDSTWLDRPLGIAGRVFIRNKEHIFKPKEFVVDSKRAECIIPNLAIHMNRQVNDGHAYNKQNELMPLVLSTMKDVEESYINTLCVELIERDYNIKIEKEDILDFDLYLYEYEKASLVGAKGEFISSGRLDNLSSAYASIEALIDTTRDSSSAINMAVVFNNEEVGSLSKEGADSRTLENIIERICIGLGKSREEMLMAIENSFMLSADLAHAVHPNYKDQADPTNKPEFGKGLAIKIHAGKAYASDAQSVSVFTDICKRAGIEYQLFTNRSDKRSGSTIGSIVSSKLSMPIVDFGMPILAMHSIRELAMVEDYNNYRQAMKEFFSI
ncbi:M18 family aminopeptidase [Peptostreptococcus equinus]|uniref:M18 family aminopeptidase n=1 Tax=Peptostreptococcus equinus TaxID=3003601 RepID=A0ABY7JP40_9FIRM|nr:M18 family aminopeptidase [Peptostreptococcus sp. CBA3647]WAW15117.1 M18 family aminopeptidase [Peptostreptococcus sp. CBA3647]